MDEQFANFLVYLRGDIFKLLPMKEAALRGEDNHLGEYIDSLLVNAMGAVKTYPQLAESKPYLNVINNIQYLSSNEVDLKKWRKLVFDSTNAVSGITPNGGKTDG